MGDHVTADLDQMRWLADRLAEAETTMSDGRSDASARPGDFDVDSMPSAAFGNTSGAPDCYIGWLSVEMASSAAYDNLAGMLTSDVDRLGEVIACFERTDLESADEICAAGGGLNVFTTHVHSEAGERGDGHDRTRAGQINQAVDHVVDSGGPTVFTGDLNETRTSHTRSGDTISEIVDQFGYTDAGVAAGGTSSSEERIDYVFTSPGLRPAGPADRVEGHPSDHDGIAVDIEVPPDW